MSDTYGDKFVAKDGTLHETRAGMEGHNASAESSDRMLGFAGILLQIYLFIPKLIARVIGLLFGALFGARMVGKIIQSAIWGAVLSYVLAAVILLSAASFFPSIKDIQAPLIVKGGLMLAFALLPTLWYYYSHYYSLRAAGFNSADGISDAFDGNKFAAFVQQTHGVSKIFASTFTTAFNAFIAIIIVVPCLGFFNILEIPRNIQNLIFLIPLPLAIISYIRTMLGSREDAKELKSQIGSPIYGAVAAVVLATVIALQPILKDEARVKGNMGYVVSNYAVGATLIAPHDDVKIYEEPMKSAVVKELKRGDRLTSTGKAVFNTEYKGSSYIPVNFNGVKGYVDSDYAMAITQTATAKQGAIFRQEFSYTDKNGNTHKPENLNLNSGAKLEITFIDEERNEARAFYDGHIGRIDMKQIQIWGLDGKSIDAPESSALVTQKKAYMFCSTCEGRSKNLKKGDYVTVIGKPDKKCAEIVYEGDTGTVYLKYIKLQKKHGK
jgi:uncharacterized protein YgiM (DUF1202 family)